MYLRKRVTSNNNNNGSSKQTSKQHIETNKPDLIKFGLLLRSLKFAVTNSSTTKKNKYIPPPKNRNKLK